MSLQNAPRTYSSSIESRRLTELDVRMRRLNESLRLLSVFTPLNAREERARLLAAFERGAVATPRWEFREVEDGSGLWREFETCRGLSEGNPARELYLKRLEEMEFELAIVQARENARELRTLTRRRFGDGKSIVRIGSHLIPLREVADEILATSEREREAHTVPAQAESGRDLFRLMHAMARTAGLEIAVKVEPRLASGAAAGDRTVFIAERSFGRREALRFAVHEVLGHLVSAFNGRAQILGLLALGTQGAFEDQEGVALCLEERAGLLDDYRLSTLAARVVVTDLVHEGVRFQEAVHHVHRELHFSLPDALGLCERAYRGGGLARDAIYLQSWLRVRHALEQGFELEELQCGKVAVSDVATLRRLRQQGWLKRNAYTPSLARSLGATAWGTSLDTSPPSFVTSLTKLDAT